MADWKQITARIRRARTGKDPAAQLSSLYEKTQDAMVAFELARVFETASQNAEAAKWYNTAAERFRRADWKTKAQEAATRLGGESTPDSQLDFPQLVPPPRVSEDDASSEDSAAIFDAIASPNAEMKSSDASDEAESESDSESPTEEASAGSSGAEKPSAENGRRRRGRRGGRNRRKPRGTTTTSRSGTHSQSESTSSARAAHTPSESTMELTDEPRPVRSHESSMPRLPVEAMPAATDAGGIALRGRYGDPGLSSRLSLLEMQFRRLLTCSPIKLDEIEKAPAGPGVLLLTDSDLTSYYYVEACQTLRIAIPSVLRGGASRRGGDSIKQPLADHLGIPEARVGKYLAEHCVIRWLQLDEGASHFAHFVNAVLRPVLNE
ncbi:MAG TPA: hypothetical protein VH022_10875 [Candidatus Acidoferrum sp.]|jgi:hypothetical protein|nr:hypothetical protein [Candidatus Acidoferrum sp.]